MPPSDFGNLLVANWAEAVLFFPEVEQPLLPLEVSPHVNIESFFIVGFPCRVVWICLTSNLGVPLDSDIRCIGEVFGFSVNLAVEHPLVSSNGCEVLLLNPCFGLLWMSSLCPSPEQVINCVVYCIKGLLADHMLMISCPSPNDWVQFHD